MKKKKIPFPDLKKLKRDGALLYVYQTPLPEAYRDKHPSTSCLVHWHYFGVDKDGGELSSGTIANFYDKKHCVSRLVREIANSVEFAEWMSANERSWREHWAKKFGSEK